MKRNQRENEQKQAKRVEIQQNQSSEDHREQKIKVKNTRQGSQEVDTLAESVWEGDMWELEHFPHDRSPP